MGLSKEKKRKREDGEFEEDTEEDEEPSIRDGEKVFMRSRTSRLHYREIVKEMEYIRDSPLALITPSMIDWILACEIKRSKSRNINGTVARQMREYLIKLYCAVEEIQKQKDETEKLKKHLDEMKRNTTVLQKENINLKRELELIKRKIERPITIEHQEVGKKNQTPIREVKRNRKKSSSSLKEGSKKKRNSQPSVIPLAKGGKSVIIRRELSYPMDNFNSSRTEKEEQKRDFNFPQLTGKRKESADKINSARKSHRRLDSVGDSTKKNRDKGRSNEKGREEHPELWSRVLGKKEKRRNNRERNDIQNRKGGKEETNKLRKPLKTSAVVITTEDRGASYSEILTWARQTVELSEEESKAINTKRSATGGILLEIKGDKNKEIAERLTGSLRTALQKYQGVRVHRPRQMAEFTLVRLDVSATRKDVKLAIANEGGCSPDDVNVGTIKTSPRGIGFVWAKCPLIEANYIAEKKRIKIGLGQRKSQYAPGQEDAMFPMSQNGTH